MPDSINPSAPIIGSTRLWVVITCTTVIVVARVLLFAFVSRKPARSLLHLWAWIERALPGRPRLESIPLLLYLIDGSGRGIGWMFLSWYGCGFSYCLYHLHAWGPPQRSSWERIAIYPTYVLLAWLIVKRLSAVFGWTLLVAVALLLGIVTYMDFYPAAYTRRCPPKIAAIVRGSCALIEQILLFPPGVFFLYTFSTRPPSIKFDFGPADAADSDFRRRYTSTGPSSHAFPPDDTTSAGYIGTFDPLPVPPGCSEVVARVLTATSHYAVLGVEERANEDQIRRAKRMLSLQTHPDKAGSQPGAADACQRVLEAADVLLDDRLRQEYDKDLALLRLATSDKGAAVRETVADRLYEETGIDIDQIGSSIMCPCQYCHVGVHQLLLVPEREPRSARWCDDCRVYHPVQRGEIWIESRRAWLGGLIPARELVMFMCEYGPDGIDNQLRVWDATPIGTCCGILEEWVKHEYKTNTHVNILWKAARGGKSNRADGGGGGGGRTASSSTSGTTHNKTQSGKSRKKGKKGRKT